MGHHYQPVFGAGLPEAVYRWQTSRQVKKKGKQHGPVVQLVRMPACHAGGRGFEPLPGRQSAQIAQLVEQRTENPRVAGSIPALGTICGFNSVVECHLAKVKVASSNLVTRSKFKTKDWRLFSSL